MRFYGPETMDDRAVDWYTTRAKSWLLSDPARAQLLVDALHERLEPRDHALDAGLAEGVVVLDLREHLRRDRLLSSAWRSDVRHVTHKRLRSA